MWVLDQLWLNDLEFVARSVDEFSTEKDFKKKLLDFIESRWIKREFPWINNEVIKEISKYREVHAIMFWAEISEKVFENRNRFPWYSEIMWWIPEIDEDCKWFPRSHEEALRMIIRFYFLNRK